MPKKAKKSVAKSSGARKYAVHKKLEQPVHNTVSYFALLLLAGTTLMVIMSLMNR